jgi:hypothetical protein
MKYGGQVGLGAITHNYLLLCEGMHDKQFFDYLMAEHTLPQFQTASCGFITNAPPNRDGVDYLTGALDALPGIPGFGALEAILVVADNDDNPPASFGKVQRLIGAATGHTYSVPSTELTKAGTSPILVVMMLPWTGQRGALDTLCLSAAANR